MCQQHKMGAWNVETTLDSHTPQHYECPVLEHQPLSTPGQSPSPSHGPVAASSWILIEIHANRREHEKKHKKNHEHENTKKTHEHEKILRWYPLLWGWVMCIFACWLGQIWVGEVAMGYSVQHGGTCRFTRAFAKNTQNACFGYFKIPHEHICFWICAS